MKYTVVIALIVILGGCVAGYVTYLKGPFEILNSSQVTLKSSPEEVWKVLGDFEGWATWAFEGEVETTAVGMQWPGEPSRDPETPPGWVFGSEPPTSLETWLIGYTPGVGGTWKWTIESAGEGSRVTIFEECIASSKITLWNRATVLEPHDRMDTALRGLAEKLGEKAEPVHVEARDPLKEEMRRLGIDVDSR